MMILKENYKSILWGIIIFILSIFKLSTASIIEDKLIPHSDKLVHLFLYTLFSFLLLIENKKSKRNIFLLLFAIIYGILMELLQHFFTSYRSFEFYDILANSFGAILGFILFTQIRTKLQL